MPEEGFSFLEIQTHLENVTLHKPKVPLESYKFWDPLPLYDRLGLPFISATRKVNEYTKKQGKKYT